MAQALRAQLKKNGRAAAGKQVHQLLRLSKDGSLP
jgi:hypothetical protein